MESKEVKTAIVSMWAERHPYHLEYQCQCGARFSDYDMREDIYIHCPKCAKKMIVVECD